MTIGDTVDCVAGDYVGCRGVIVSVYSLTGGFLWWKWQKDYFVVKFTERMIPKISPLSLRKV